MKQSNHMWTNRSLITGLVFLIGLGSAITGGVESNAVRPVMAEDRQERKAPQKPKASEEQKQTSAVSALPTTPQTLNPGEKHTYPLKLKANDYLKLTVEQQGIDVVVRLVGPDGKTIQEVDSPNGTQGPEPLSAIVEQAGNYILEIEPLGKTGQPGKYELNLESIKTANEQDKKEIEIKYFLSKALTLESSGKYQDALLFARQAFDKSKMLNDPLLLSDCYTVLAINYFQLKDIRNAEQNFLNALEIRETVLGPDHPFVALILNRLALLYKSSLRYSKAEPMYLRALTICEKTLGPSDDQVRVILNNLALLYDAKGDYAKAELFLNRSLEISEPNNPISLNNLASFYFDKGDYSKAEPLFQKALVIREQSFGREHPDVALSLVNLSNLHKAKGDLAKTEILLLEAQKIYDKIYSPDHPYILQGLTTLGYLYISKKEYLKAELMFKKSNMLLEKLRPNHPNVASNLNGLGELARIKRNYKEAEKLFKQALAINEHQKGSFHLSITSSLNNLGLVYYFSRNFVEAEKVFLRALALWEKNRPNHPTISIATNNLAIFYWSNNKIAQGIQYLRKSNEVIEEDLIRNLISGSQRQKMLYLETTNLQTDQTISFHIQSAPQNLAMTKAALTVIFRRKGRALDAMTSAIETLRRNQTPEIQKLLDDYTSLNSQISVLTLRGPGKQKAEDHLAYLKELNSQREQLEADISTRSTEFKAQVTPITLENVQRAIPPNTSLVEYAVYRPFDAKTQKYSTPRFVAYLLNQKGEIRFADLGEAAPIESAVAAFRRAVRNQSSSDQSVRGGKRKDAEKEKQNVKVLGRKLEALVFAPVRKLLGPTTRVLLSPDGVLNLVPFDALVADDGKYLVETYEFSYLTSGRDLLRLQTGIKNEQPPLVVANPDYADGNGPKLLGEQFQPLKRLPGTTAEAEYLKTTFPTSAVFSDAQATEGVLTAAKRPEFLHIGTHGYFFPDVKSEPVADAEPSRVLNGEDRPIDVEKVRQENPLLRSYLFFAGANHSDGTTENDGILTALEASGLNLWGTKLVVLSACDTGVGDVHNGDGVYGLRRALVLAGSESQMVSLWPVSDEGTRDLMIKYYQLLKVGAGRSQALRQIRLEFLKNPKRNHPYFWASFILSGEWANLEGKR